MYYLLYWLPELLCVCLTCAVLFLIGVVFRLYDHLVDSRAELKNLREALIERGLGAWTNNLGNKQGFIILSRQSESAQAGRASDRWKEKED